MVRRPSQMLSTQFGRRSSDTERPPLFTKRGRAFRRRQLKLVMTRMETSPFDEFDERSVFVRHVNLTWNRPCAGRRVALRVWHGASIGDRFTRTTPRQINRRISEEPRYRQSAVLAPPAPQ